MWERFISWYINTYLGRYIENLNFQQLSFALHQGELELENVPLKKNIFRSWGLPIEVRSGVVGRIRIEFNILKYFRNEPVLISIEDIYLVAGPLNLSEWDPMEEDIISHEAKMSALDSHEARWKAHNDLAANSASYYSSLYFSSMRIGASIVTKVVENLQLNVRNVHIRFETEVGVGQSRTRTVAFGITLESLTAQSCDAQWKKLSSNSDYSSDCSFKTLQLNKLAVYCDTKAEKFSHYKPEDLKAAMSKLAITHDYILCPVSAEARIAKNNSSNPLRTSSKARFDVHLTLEKVPLQLSDSQYRQANIVFKAFRKLQRNCRLRHYRPFVPVTGNAKAWWQYAVSAVLIIRGYKKRKRLKTWEEVIQRAKDNAAYIKAYEQHLVDELLPVEVRKIKDRFEDEFHYEEILILREFAMARIDAANNSSGSSGGTKSGVDKPAEQADNAVAAGTEVSNQSVLGWLFPSWTGWASSNEVGEKGLADLEGSLDDELSPTLSSSLVSNSSDSRLSQGETELEEAILDDIKAFDQDAVLARFHFILKQGNVTIKKKTVPFLEFEFTGVDLRAEIRPRTGAHKLQLTLASVFLRDFSTKSLIVSPHTPSSGKPGMGLPTTAKELLEPLFRLAYERKPQLKTVHVVSVTTRPLDLVIYPVLWEDVTKFFTVSTKEDDLELPVNGYEAMKQRTKEEIYTYWKRLIHQREGSSLGNAASWDIIMNICAPQIVIHGAKESRGNIKKMYSSSSGASSKSETPRMDTLAGPFRLTSGSVVSPRDVEPFVVIDLGRFRFTNLSESEVLALENAEKERLSGKDFICDSKNMCSGKEQVINEDLSDNEEFLTPCSSPAAEVASPNSNSVNSPRQSVSDISEATTLKSPDDAGGGEDLNSTFGDLRTKLYKKYRLEILDVQVLVVEGKAAKEGHWKGAVLRGTSALHLVDKFSINLQLERRMIYSDDPHWPALALVATLPKWNLHFNETKMYTIRSVLGSFLSKSTDSSNEELNKMKLSSLGGSQVSLQDDVSLLHESKAEGDGKPEERKSDSKLFVAQFTIQNVTVEIQSRGRSIAELQIIGARTSFTATPVDTSVSFVIQSLLLADAVQTFGPDFELLLASHKHVSMDSMSGSLRDSDPTSPVSPSSPGCASPGPYHHTKSNNLAVPSQLHDALVSSLQGRHRTRTQENLYDFMSNVSEDVLITAELVLDNTDLALLSVQFNNLDLIANQETILEISQFLQRAFPPSEPTPESRPKSETKLIDTGGYRLKSSFDFHRLNILLVRGVFGKDGNQCARKIATATASSARVNVSIGNGGDISVEGSLGGLQMLNLTPEGQYHQRVLSVGQDPLVDGRYCVFSKEDVNSSVAEELLASCATSALTFSFDKPSNESAPPKFQLHMASVIYTHCPTFLVDLKKCISEFQAPLATKLRSAAAQIALGLVRQDGSSYRSPQGSLSGSLDKLNVEEESFNKGPDGMSTERGSLVVRLEIVLDSPVIVLPKSRTSPEVLVANLGQITVRSEDKKTEMKNSAEMFEAPRCSTPECPSKRFQSFDEGTEKIIYNVQICDVSLYSLDLTEKWNMMENMKYTFPTSNYTSMIRALELYYCDPATSKPILHNTVIHIGVCYVEDPPFINAMSLNQPFFCDSLDEDCYNGPELELQGRVVNPLKVSLTPQQYAQVMDSLNNIAPAEDQLCEHEVHLTENKMRWKQEEASYRQSIMFGKAPPNPMPLPSPTGTADDSLPIKASFEIPELIVELVLPENTSSKVEKPHLSLSCSELCFECDKKGFLTEMKLNLKSLTLENTSAPAESPHRFLAMSNTTLKPERSESSLSCATSSLVNDGSQNYERYVSSSCPDIPKSVPIYVPDTAPYHESSSNVRMEPSSLPDHLDPSDIFGGRFLIGKSQKSSRPRKTSVFTSTASEIPEGRKFCPATPPPSPRCDPNDTAAERFINLVQITMCFVDPKSPEFMPKFHGTHKFVNVDFNALEILLTPDTFTCLRKFFSDAGKHEAKEKERTEAKPQVSSDNFKRDIKSEIEDEKNTETKISVKALSVKVASPRYTLAEGRVTGVVCNFVNRGRNFFGVEGRLGSLQIRDVSPHVGKYPVKFTFQGKQALDFDYCRKVMDGKFRLQMSSVVCVHTHRFYTEFTALMSSLFGGSSSAFDDTPSPTSGSARTEPMKPSDKNVSKGSVRVSLDIQAGAPVLLFPYSSSSRHLLVADLGHLSVKNKIVEESKDVICDKISVDLIEMDLFAAELQYNASELIAQASGSTGGILKLWSLDRNRAVMKTCESSSFLKEKCALKLKVRRFLKGEDVDPTQARTSIEGTLSTVCCFLDPEKYKLIRGLLEYNIGEQLGNDEPQPPSTLSSRRASLGGLIPGDLPPSPAPHFSLVRKELSIELDLVNVTLELIKEHGTRLSRVDFIKSKFTFQNNSDGTKDVDLASQEILICDSRFSANSSGVAPTYKNVVTAENVFTNILQQSSGTCCATSPMNSGTFSGSFQSNTCLQAELHYRMTPRGSSITVVLNNMRLMLILDWWMELKGFISQRGPVPEYLANRENEEPKRERTSASPLLKRSRQVAAPVTVSAGIVTKRAPILDVPATTFELKLNISNCELVVVEDPSVWDTSAIILKSTAVLNYKPHLERPVTCTLLQCELFSCILGLEAETALSIVDPTDINFELVRRVKSEPQGIMDATLSPSNSAKILRIQSPQICLRLSYYDMKMFVQLMDRFSKQARLHLLHDDSADLSLADDQQSIASSCTADSIRRVTSFDDASVHQLVSMGFSRQESEDALAACCGRVDEAAIYLSSAVKNLETHKDREFSSSSVQPDLPIALQVETAECSNESQLAGIEIKCSVLSLCVIDDCKDADVPLLELNVNGLELMQNCIDNSGQAECNLGIDYFNRELSGWEPFLEAWKCAFQWKKNEIGQLGHQSPGSEFPTKAPELELSVSSRQVLNVNVTSTLLNLYKTVSFNWSEDYSHQKVDKRRAPFVPFLLKNETGSELWFSTVVPNNEDLIKQQRNLSCGAHSWNTVLKSDGSDGTSWINVPNGGCHAFSFEGRGKLRHRNTHALRTHQLAVRVDGWHEIVPVSLDRVGTYFRVAKPVVSNMRFGTTQDLPFTRLVFEVSLLGSAQKLVRVRSALLLKNCLNDNIELKLENTIVYPSFAKEQTGGSFVAQVKSGESYPIPLHSVWAQLWVRPTTSAVATSPSPYSQSSLYRYCESHLLGPTEDGLRSCFSLAENQLQPYRFCVAVQKDEFPADEDDLYRVPKLASTAAQYLQMSKKVNVVVLVSPLTVVNLLPVDLSYEIKSKSMNGSYHGHVHPGKESRLTNVNTAEQVEILFNLENFPHGNSITVSAGGSGYVTKLRVLDIQKRPLILTARVVKGDGNSIAVYLSCPYWIVNKAGIPIVCKQEGSSEEAAGQFMEHEMGRMVAPLLFSFSDQEGSSQLTLRVGAKQHGDNCKPLWSRSFYLQNGMQVRKLAVSCPSPRTEIVYVVGIEIKSGRGRYRDSRLITIAPRFTIDNRSSRKVQISQKCFATSFLDPAAEATHLELTPGCNLPFHWPRLDREQLLCVRLADIKGGLWTGGFPIENVDSFHIPVRNYDGACSFLRVEIVIQGPTYFIVLGDTDKLPPPFRVDNFSFVPITFHQTAVGDEKLKIMAKAESCCPFAWDEPTQPPHLTLSAPGGTSAVVAMDALGLAAHLTYENFFYIAFTATFPADELARAPVVGMESLQLVMDVEGNKVVLRPKEPGKRSQLWRVNADGLIEHEGSSPPREPRKPAAHGSSLVLDIAGSGPQPAQYTPLMLRKPDKRRASTQHWDFTPDGRLKCEKLDNLYVQAKDGFGIPLGSSQDKDGRVTAAQWNKWNDVVLGPDQPICYSRTDTGIPAEQAVCKQKLRPGSGRLSLTVDTDGPTRVLRVVDVEKPPRSKMLHHKFEETTFNTIPKLLANVCLRSGLGVSIVNCKPREELVYIRLTSLSLKYSDSKESELCEITVDSFQIDNQLLEAEKPVAVCVLPTPRYEMDEYGTSGQPALHLSWQRMKSKLNAHVFKTCEMTVKPLNVIIEERLLLKLCSWIGLSEKFEVMEGLQESDFEVQKALTNATSLTAKRFYFGELSIHLNQVRLSVLTSSKLASDLTLIKRRLGLTLIRFEEAQVELDPFEKQHPFETFEFLIASVFKHYKDELLSQAAIILGSTDFLGNPLGFVNDVSVGVSGLIYEGSIGSLVKNVTHGLSNSAAKVTGSLGDGLGLTTLDDRHEEERRKIREEASGSSGEQFVAGLRGLKHGLIGGLSSIVVQSIDGAATDGITGFVAGLGKGIVGTVTKPAVGILDLASGAASAIRDSSRTSSRMIPDRVRPPRVATGLGGLLPVYSEMAARGQDLLYDVNDRNYGEVFIAVETLMSGPGRDLRILISSQAVTVFKPGKGNQTILKVMLSELIESRVVTFPDGKVCIELIRILPGPRGLNQHNSPQVTCDTETVAHRVVQQINYAKVLYEETRHSQIEKATSPTEY